MSCNMMVDEFESSQASCVFILFLESLSDQYGYLAEPLCSQNTFKGFATSEI